MVKNTADYSEETFLVIDDNDLYRKFMKTLIEKNFYARVQEAISPKEAFEWLEFNKPMLIILDMEMPYMDGYSFLKIIRGNETTRNIPVIGCSALASEELIKRLAKLNISAYIQKSSETKVVISKISNVLSNIKYTTS